VHLTPTERDHLELFLVAELAQRRRERGLRLNAPEATAIVCSAVIEAARDGRRHSEAVQIGQQVLSVDEVLPGVAEVVGDVSVEARFDDGNRLVVVPEPFGPGVEIPDPASLDSVAAGALPPGTVLTEGDPREPAIRAVRSRPGLVSIEVRNTGEVPISITSHFHFFEVNHRLAFDRAAAYGKRLALSGGETVSFRPGESKTVELVDIGGARVAIGYSGYVDGPLDDPQIRDAAFARARAAGLIEDNHEGGAR
jgi:urease subunit gamma/beta